jgi:hypothetical protein
MQEHENALERGIAYLNAAQEADPRTANFRNLVAAGAAWTNIAKELRLGLTAKRTHNGSYQHLQASVPPKVDPGVQEDFRRFGASEDDDAYPGESMGFDGVEGQDAPVAGEGNDASGE